MKLRELVKKLNAALDDFGDRDIVATEVKIIDGYVIRLDMPVFDIAISDDHQNEICLITLFEPDSIEGCGLIGFIETKD
jgi:hypothetical protein